MHYNYHQSHNKSGSLKHFWYSEAVSPEEALGCAQSSVSGSNGWEDVKLLAWRMHWLCSPNSVHPHATHQRSGFFGFFRRDFSKMALALVSCPTFSSSLDSKSHRGMEWGHFFNWLKKKKKSMVICRFEKKYYNPYRKEFPSLHTLGEFRRREIRLITSLEFLLVSLTAQKFLLHPNQFGTSTTTELSQQQGKKIHLP